MANLIRRGGEGREGRELSRERSQESYWDPFRMMDAMLRWDPFRSGLGRASELNPSVDVVETKDAYVFKADLPGVREQDVQAQVTGNVLTISGEKQEESRDEGDRYHATERFWGSFARSFTLPPGADLDSVKAELKDGVLTVTVPKRPEVQPKKITIGRGGGGKPGEAKA